MFKNSKIGSRLKASSPEKPKLRMFASYQTSQIYPLYEAKTEQENSSDYSGINLSTAMLEIEYRKAKALMTIQTNRRYY